MFVCCDCCVLSGRSLCDELITRSEESYRLWCVVKMRSHTQSVVIELNRKRITGSISYKPLISDISVLIVYNKTGGTIKGDKKNLSAHCRFAAIRWLAPVMHAGEALQPPPRLAFFIHWSNSPFQLPVTDYFKAVVLYLLCPYITQTEDGVLAHCSCLCSWTQSTGWPER